MHSFTLQSFVRIAAVGILLGDAAAAALPAFDFTNPQVATAWTPDHDIAARAVTAEGLSLTIGGGDPYLFGPSQDYPVGQMLWLRLRLKSDSGGTCQIFHFPASAGATEARSVRVTVPASQWVTARVALPALGPQHRLRLDPPGTGGRCVLNSVGFELRTAYPDFDFTVVPDATEWVAANHLGPLRRTDNGLVLPITGSDPYALGPARNYPTGAALWLRLRLRSDQGGACQVFYFPENGGPSEANSVRFAVRGGDWDEVKIRMPALGNGYRLRIDPPGEAGNCTLGRLWFEERQMFAAPEWPRPTVPALGPDAAVLESGGLKVTHSRAEFGAFTVEVDAERMAAGHTTPLIGYVKSGQPRWFAVNGPNATVVVEQAPRTALADATLGGTLSARVAVVDPDGGRWQLEQNFKLNTGGTLQVEAVARCDQERDVLYLPLFTVFPGLGNYGTNKTQALLAGIEYLENEPSSSTADLNAPASDRQVTDTAKLTFPLMVVAANDRYLALAWNQPPGAPICAVFDTPDRLFQSGAQVMGLLFPGSDGLNREENSLIPYDATRMPADKAVRVAALLMGGRGRSVIPAVQTYVSLFGLPGQQEIPGGAPEYFELAGRGWLDSKIRDGDRYRHAAPGFGSMAAADAALYEDWLAGRVEDPALATRLRAGAAAALAQVTPATYNHAQVGHVRYPVAALVYGAVAANLERAEQNARGQLGRFEADGFIRYQPSAGGLDYGKTHWAPDANGLTAAALATVLQEAAFTGKRELIDAGLRHLRALTRRFRDTVPRGAQTWEIPLHTPDILASAYLVNCYVLGFEVTGDATLLDEARYWAWTGVPFVYLSPPTDRPVGLYATIPVLGATQWVAPNWMGLPVQWCGLVYADAIQRLARHDAAGPWRSLAEGIVRSGIQQTYPATDTNYVGLLPDSFGLRTQTRNAANINPATLLAPAIRALGAGEIYDFRALPRQGLRLHAPGTIRDLEERADGLRFTVAGWDPRPTFVLVNGLRQTPQVRLNGVPVSLAPPHEYQAAEGRLILQFTGTTAIELIHPALAALKIERLPGNGAVKVRWPAAAAPDFTLQTATTLSGAAGWEDFLGDPLRQGDQLSVTLLPTWDQRWFRLR